jgi:hypothetical protein
MRESDSIPLAASGHPKSPYSPPGLPYADPTVGLEEADVAEVGATVLAVVIAVSLVALLATRRVMRRLTDPDTARLVVLALVAKLVGTAVYFAGLSTWMGGGDADVYFKQGRRLAPMIRAGVMPEQASQPGTPFVDFLTGLVLAWTGVNKATAFLVFSLLGFVGMVLFVLALRLAVPEANHRRYTVLVLFLPSMVFWTSNLGKDSWMIFTLGLASYGSARLLRRSRGGYLLVALGVAGTYMVRPHMAALIGASLALAFLVRLGDDSIRRSGVTWVVGLALIMVGAGYVGAHWAADLMGDEDATTSAVLERTDAMTAEGGSKFDGRSVRSPGDLMHAVITVPFRPFPTEAHNVPALLTSFEGLLLLGLVLASVGRASSALRLSVRRPYVGLCAIYCLGFIIAFASVNNFGILVRQRTQMLPFLLVLLSLPRAPGRLPVPDRGSLIGRRRRPAVVLETVAGLDGADRRRRRSLTPWSLPTVSSRRAHGPAEGVGASSPAGWRRT